ncbi:MAG: hypothetical protein M3459_01750, partial [Actinomycetota bacterium]|nr:hypothetical protein [Actinomycetota bacterium]
AARWLARLTLERPDVNTRHLRVGLQAFDLVAIDHDGGRGQLANLAAGLGIDDAHVLLRGAPARRGEGAAEP